jgi:hypothetical protein
VGVSGWGLGVGGGGAGGGALRPPRRISPLLTHPAPTPRTPALPPTQVHELFDAVGDEPPPPPGSDMSAEAWLRSKGATPRQLAVADVCYANDFGATLSQLGLREMIVENNGWGALGGNGVGSGLQADEGSWCPPGPQGPLPLLHTLTAPTPSFAPLPPPSWDSGETYLLADRSMRFVVDKLAEGAGAGGGAVALSSRVGAGGWGRGGFEGREGGGVWAAAASHLPPNPTQPPSPKTQPPPHPPTPPCPGLDIVTSFPVTSIQYGPSGALLTGPGGRQLRARTAVVTASLRVLQQGKVAFSPPLPAAKRGAIQRLRMGNAVKVGRGGGRAGSAFGACVVGAPGALPAAPPLARRTSASVRPRQSLFCRPPSPNTLTSMPFRQPTRLHTHARTRNPLPRCQVVCAFSRRFWPEDFYDAVCTDTFAPEIWSTQHAPVAGGAHNLHAMVGEWPWGRPGRRAAGPTSARAAPRGRAPAGRTMAASKAARPRPLACSRSPCPQQTNPPRPAPPSSKTAGFIAGPRADGIAAIGAPEAARRFLAQLDAMFGTPSDPAPASGSYVRHEVFDWSQQEWVGGAYSFPSLGAEAGDRAALAAPVGGVLFFAGEATHEAVNPCMQAALETGGRAAAQALAALRPAPLRSKL